jgi:hypothetical protein
MHKEKRLCLRGRKMNQTIKQHLDERERITTRKLLAEMNSNVPNLTHISVLRQELRDIQDERNEYEEKDICNKYNQEQIGGIL